jgi:hypothetical protein
VSKLVVWSSVSTAEIVVFADYLERHGCQVISVTTPMDIRDEARVYARAPEDFNSMHERGCASALMHSIVPGKQRENMELDAGVTADVLIDTYLDFARKYDS